MIEIRDRFHTGVPAAGNVSAMHNRTLPAATVVLFALGYPLGALTLADISPFLLIVLRFMLSAVLVWSFVAIRRLPLPRGRTLRWSIVCGLLVQGAQFLGLYWGLAHGVSPGIGALVIAMNPVATAVLGRVLFRATENGWGLLALLSGAVGVVAACVPRVLADPSIGPGICTVLIGLGGLSVGSIVQGRALGSVDPWVFTAIGVTVSIPFALIPTIAVIASWALLHDRIDATILLALVCGALACIAQSRAGRVDNRTEPHVSAPFAR